MVRILISVYFILFTGSPHESHFVQGKLRSDSVLSHFISILNQTMSNSDYFIIHHVHIRFPESEEVLKQDCFCSELAMYAVFFHAVAS